MKDKKTETKPDTRLLSAVPYLKKQGRVADIGTDHAYLPIYLLQNGICACALACDINQGPIERAKEHIALAGLQEKIATLRTDGLHGVKEFAPDNIIIFGMGGELIVKILAEAEWIKNQAIGLVLQPMTKSEVLRQWLNQNGFVILGETLSYEDQYYQTIYAEWRGQSEEYSCLELLVGKKILASQSRLLTGLLKQKIGVYERIVKGKAQAKESNDSYEAELLCALKQALKKAEEGK